MYKGNKMKVSGNTLAVSCITLVFVSSSSMLQASSLFGEELLNSVIKSVAKEIVKQPQQKTAPQSKVVQQPKATPQPQQYHRPQQAQSLWFSYKDWSASTETVLSGGGDWVTSCEIHTGGDGDSSISVSQIWGEPMPSVVYSEATARGYATALQGEQEVTWAVSVGNEVRNFAGSSYTGVSESGIPFAENTVNSTYQGGEVGNILRAFAKGREVMLIDDYSGGDLHVGSLSGFTAAYRKMSLWCGFSVDKIL